MALDPTGRYLYVAISGALALAVYRVDDQNGGTALGGTVLAPPHTPLLVAQRFRGRRT